MFWEWRERAAMVETRERRASRVRTGESSEIVMCLCKRELVHGHVVITSAATVRVCEERLGCYGLTKFIRRRQLYRYFRPFRLLSYQVLPFTLLPLLSFFIRFVPSFAVYSPRRTTSPPEGDHPHLLPEDHAGRRGPRSRSPPCVLRDTRPRAWSSGACCGVHSSPYLALPANAPPALPDRKSFRVLGFCFCLGKGSRSPFS